MSLDCGRTLERLDKTHTGRENLQTAHRRLPSLDLNQGLRVLTTAPHAKTKMIKSQVSISKILFVF